MHHGKITLGAASAKQRVNIKDNARATSRLNMSSELDFIHLVALT